MLRPEESPLDHRSLLPRRLLAAKATISPVDKKRNRRSLELHFDPDCKRGLFVSKTADSLTNSAETLRKVIRQDSNDSLKRGLLTDSLTASVEICPKSLVKQISQESLKIKADVTEAKEPVEWQKVSSSEQAKRLFFLSPPEEACARRGLLAPVSEEGGGGGAPAREELVRQRSSWYAGYGTLPHPPRTPDKTASSGSGRDARTADSPPPPPAPRRALELLAPGLRGLAARRLHHPVRRAASRDSALDAEPPPRGALDANQQGLRKCSTVLALSSRSEPLRAVNRLRAPSVCSRCSSLLSLAGGSRYSLDRAGAGFVPAPPAPAPAPPLLCKLCLEDAPSERVTTIQGCGCAFCTKCMQAYVEFEVCNGAYEVSCPDAQCRLAGALSLDEIRRLISAEGVQKHLRFRLNHEVGMDQERAFCPRAGCDTVVRVQPASPAHCPSCRHDFCPDCNQEWHGGRPCAGAAGAGAGAPLLADGELIKWCPMCRVPIEKDEGCAQMMCKRCKHVFCWYCLASLDDDFLLRHYDKGPCKNKLGHSRASVIWHRAQVVGIFAGFGLLLLVASPLLLLAAPCIVCCKCRLCNPNSAKNLEEAEDIEVALQDKARESDKREEAASSSAAASSRLTP